MPPARRKHADYSLAYRLSTDTIWNLRADYIVRKHHKMSAKSPARAPPSSPRLPSPPPLPELQLGPRSPSINASGGELSLEDAAAQDEGAARRVRPGTSATDMARGPPFVPLHQLETPFQLQEYLKSSYSNLTRDENSNTVKPITKESAMQLANPPIQQDTGDPVNRQLWLYELCRFLVQRTNRLIVSFFADTPPCSSQTCPEMRASEWQYLCAVHEPPKSCCAIDYCCHTLDWAANVLTSPKHFPSRLSPGEGGGAYQSMRQLTNIFRRVYRIYAHAWFQHREAFWSLEQEEGLYKFFRTVCDAYSLIPEDNYTIPNEAEAEREESMETPVNQKVSDVQILSNVQVQEQAPATTETDSAAVPAAGPTVRRHRPTPSAGSIPSMNAIAEGPEEEETSSQTTQVSDTNTQMVAPALSKTSPPPRSPRPAMSIPIDDSKAELVMPEDPTPTPESHASDPFSESASTEATEPTLSPINTSSQRLPVSESFPRGTEPATPISAIALGAGYEIPISTTPIPSLNTSTPPRAINEDEEIRSPGGGSFRSIGGDILSGILRHVDNDDSDSAHARQQGVETPDSSTASSEGSWSVVEREVSPPAKVEKLEEKVPETQSDVTNIGEDKPAEDLEEMGEISLVETAVIVTSGTDEGGKEPVAEAEKKEEGETETKTEADAPKDEETPAEEKPTEEKEEEKEGVKEKVNDDGTKLEETPSGVV